VPGFSHRDLEGVLVGVQVPSLDDPDALGELRDRVSDALGLKGNTSRWNKEQAKFLARLDGLVERLEGARKVPFEDLERANSERDGAQEALKEVENERRELEERFEELKKAKTREEALEVALPKEEQARFEALRMAAQARLKKLPRVVRTAISYSLRSEEMPRPSRWDDDIGADEVARAERDGYLCDGAGDSVLPDTDVMAVADAVAAVRELQYFFDNEVSEEFDEGFKREHGAPPDLARGIVWDALFGRWFV
jgi:hypothetical protein